MHHATGKLTVIYGPMFSGKTGKLIAIAETLQKMGKRVIIIKPKIDSRFGNDASLHTHDHRKHVALLLDDAPSGEILNKILSKNPDVVILDEVQFFDKQTIIDVISQLKSAGKQIVAAGLLYDFARKPFGATPDLIGLSDKNMELFSICQKCGDTARYSERLKAGFSQIVVGASEMYIAVCDSCHEIHH